MNLLIPHDIVERMRAEMRSAGGIEIGGVLMGEHVSEGTFRLEDITAQRYGGSRFGFLRYPEAHAAQLASFFERKGRRYSKFNYLGEWHSHPNAMADASTRDIEEMAQIVEDPAVGIRFAVLLIVRLTPFSCLKGTAMVFVRSCVPATAKLTWKPGRK